MIPVVMLVINTGALSSDFLTLVCLIMACPSIQHIPVIYLTAVAAVAVVFITETSARFPAAFLIRMVNGTILAHLALSLLINIYATSIIALKAWCVHFDRVIGKHSTYCALVDDMMLAYIQEIPQVADGKRCRHPNP
jgi:hypothetical protein